MGKGLIHFLDWYVLWEFNLIGSCMGKLGPMGVVFSGDLLPNVRKIKAAVRRARPPVGTMEQLETLPRFLVLLCSHYVWILILIKITLSSDFSLFLASMWPETNWPEELGQPVFGFSPPPFPTSNIRAPPSAAGLGEYCSRLNCAS